MPTYRKGHHRASIEFDCASNIGSFMSVAPGVSALTATVQDAMPSGQDFKVSHVAISCLSVANAPAIQIVAGAGVPGAVGTTDVVAVAGTTVLSAFTSVSSTTGNYAATQIINVPNQDVVYAKAGPPLTLRVLGGASDNLIGLKVTLMGKQIDPSPAATMNTNPDGTIGFGPSSF